MRPPPARLLQELIRFDTTNPPGGEGPCVRHVAALFESRGVDTQILESAGRPSLVVRVTGRGQAPPLLLQGHLDVVTVAGQRWSRPPFAGDEVDGWVWGRGALDMKGGVAMMVSALLQELDEGTPPAGDVVLCCLADEETGGVHGAGFLVDRHPGLFAGIRHALGEGGGASHQLEGRVFYPIMVAEKRICRVRLTLRGPGGHASRVHRGGTMAALARVLATLDRTLLPVHVTPVTAAYLRAVAAALGGRHREPVLALLEPGRAEAALEAMGPDAGRFDPILRHTVNATVVRAGEKINVIPAEAVIDVDGRMLPGFEPDELLRELRQVLGDGVEIEILTAGPRLRQAEMGLFFDLLGGVVRELDPEGIPVPHLMTGATDQRHFARLGIQGYGYLPLRLPPDFGQETVHAADERVPSAALDFGTEAFHRVLTRYRG
ncbi:MAG: M20/M25/M40 family metallo-hydrolase [Candidatus Dormibacteraeota bacterium]|nr:M20/M25/M40 family metallo-hydrolase [Candidatus Dormibacteraeota bacterium]